MRKRICTRHGGYLQVAWILTGLLILFPMLLSSCSERSIVGRWRAMEGEQTILYEFSEDGSFTLQQSGGILPGIPITGKYHLHKNTLFLYHEAYRRTFEYRVRGEKLILYDEEHHKSVLKKE